MMIGTPAKHLRLTLKEAWALYAYAEPGWKSDEIQASREADAARLRRAVRVGQRFRASDLRHKWHVRGVSSLLERGLWAGVLTYEGKDGLERVYRRVK